MDARNADRGTNRLISQRYRAIVVLGSDAFGETYLVEDLHTANRLRRVLKEIKLPAATSKGTKMLLQLLRRKAKELQSLNDVPYLPQSIDYFEETRSLYWVEEWVDGYSLAEKLQPGKPLTQTHVAAILKEVLVALDCLHGYGAKHRSLKPENLIWRHSDNQLVLCGLSEFKKLVARVSRAQGQPLHRTTKDAAIYIPPEQTPTHAHFNSDLYALGIMGIQAITGLGVKDLQTLQELDHSRNLKVPWRGGEIQTRSELLGILVKMVHADSKQRYQLAQDVLAELARWEKATQKPQQTSQENPEKPSISKSIASGTTNPKPVKADLPAVKASLVKNLPVKDAPKNKMKSFQIFDRSHDVQQAAIVAAGADDMATAKLDPAAVAEFEPELAPTPASEDRAVSTPTESSEPSVSASSMRLGRLGAIAATVAVAIAVAVYANVPQWLAGKYWMRQAKSDYSQGNDIAAVAAYSRVLSLNPDHGLASFQRGQAYQRMGETQLALQDLTDAINQGAAVAQAHYYRGNLRFELGDRRGAIADYTQAIAAQPDFAKAYVNRASAYSDLGKDSQAIVDYSQAIALDTTLAAAFLNRCLSYSNQGDQAAALADCNRAVELRPLHALAYQNRGLVRRRQGNIEAALEDYNTAIRLNPEDPDPYYNRGLTRWELGDNVGAIADFTYAIERNPNHVLAYYDRGLVHMKTRDREQAIADFQQSAKLCLDLGRVGCYEDAQFQLQQLQ